MSLLPVGFGASGDDYTIDDSLRFRDSASAYLSRTFASAGNRKTWTWSAWVKLGNINTDNFVFSATSGTSDGLRFRHFSTGTSPDALMFYLDDTTGGVVYTNAVFRDPSAWYHVVLAVDTTQATSSNRIKIYVNGEQQTFATAAYPSLNYDCKVNNNVLHNIAALNGSSNFDGYVTEANFIDGQALDPTDFGEFDDNGTWKPLAYTGTYGTNGFYLPFRNQGSIYDITGDARPSNGAVTRYTSAGSDTFTVPTYSSSIVVEMWGAGGGSGGSGPSGGSAAGGGAGSATTFATGSLSAGGGGGGASSGAGLGANGAGGIASNGDTNINGNAGANNSNQTFGYAAPNGYWNSFVRARIGNGSAYAGLFAGGGATGSAWYITPNYPVAGSGGSGAYLKKTFAVGDLTPGASIAVVVGTGGTAGAQGGAWAGAAGADGEILITVDGTTLTNDYYPANISLTAGTTYDLMKDTPSLVDANAGNFATLNPIASTVVSSISEANLKVSGSSNSIHGTIAVTSGKYYFEFTKNSNGDNQLGIAYGWNQAGTQSFRRTWRDGNGSPSWLTDNGTAGSGTAQSLSVGDILGVALDMDNNAIYFAKNNTWMNSGDPTSGASKTGAIWTDLSNQAWHIFAGSNANGCYVSLNCGQRPFAYTPPTGFLKLNTFNLPDSTIEKGDDYFNTVLWTGANTNAGNSVTGVGFKPDFVWAKVRSQGYSHLLYDIIRGTGATAELSTDSAGVEGGTTSSERGYLNSFDTDGFSSVVGSNGDNLYFNQTSQTYVAWNWKANGSGVSNTIGTIPSTVSANTTAGFSIVSFANTASTAETIGHGLSQAPELIIHKSRDSGGYVSWATYHKDLGAGQWINLDETTAAQSSTTIWNNTAPTTSVFSMGTAWTSSNNFIAYCFHSVEGYSSIGSYTGNSSSDGTFVYTGFRPAFVLLKLTSAAENWVIFDDARNEYNLSQLALYSNSAGAEVTISTNGIDMLSNGFKLRGTGNRTNGSGQSYIYMAFAENPFKNANAR